MHELGSLSMGGSISRDPITAWTPQQLPCWPVPPSPLLSSSPSRRHARELRKGHSVLSQACYWYHARCCCWYWYWYRSGGHDRDHTVAPGGHVHYCPGQCSCSQSCPTDQSSARCYSPKSLQTGSARCTPTATRTRRSDHCAHTDDRTQALEAQVELATVAAGIPMSCC
jgi:hypothetical protein